MNTQGQLYIGIMSGTSMDGADAVLIAMNGNSWQGALAHSFLPYSDSLKQQLLDLQNASDNELHRSMLLAQELSVLYAQTVQQLLENEQLNSQAISAIGCHGQTIRHAPEHSYSIQLANLSVLAERTDILTVGDFRSGDLAAGGQGAPLVPAFHSALFHHPQENRILINIGGIANISVLPANLPAFGFDTGPGNMLMDAWVYQHWQQPFDANGEKAAQGQVLPDLLAQLLAHPYLQQPHPKSTGRDLFSLAWLEGYLNGNEDPYNVLRTLLEYTAQTIINAIISTIVDAQNVYICGGGIRNSVLMGRLETMLTTHKIQIQSTAVLNLNPQWVEAAAFGWLAACWVNRVPSNPHHATGARKPCILGAGYFG